MYSEHCFEYVHDQVKNIASSNFSLSVLPYHFPPYTSIRLQNEETGQMQVCGPLSKILNEFAQKYMINIKMNKPVNSKLDFLQVIFYKQGHLVLVSSSSSTITKYCDTLIEYGLDFKIGHSDPVDFYELNRILSKTSPGTLSVLPFLRIFPTIVWLLIFVSIFLISSFNSITTSSPRKLFAYFWNYFEILYSRSIQKRLKRTKSKIILALWLMSAYYLSIGFTSILMEFMIRGIPVIKIDSLSDLAQRTDLTIVSRGDGAFMTYLDSLDKEISNNFRNRLIPYIDFTDVMEELVVGLRKGTTTFVSGKENILFKLLEVMERETISENEPKLSDLLHISEESFTSEPYFLIFNSETDAWIQNSMNHLLILLRESGLYTKWMSDVINYNHKRFGNINQKSAKILFDYNKLRIKDQIDIFYLYDVIIVISLIIFSFEMFYNKFS